MIPQKILQYIKRWKSYTPVSELLLCLLLLLPSGCLFYSFSGSSLSQKAKTFTVHDLKSKVALGPATLADQITQSLRDELVKKTRLKEKATEGDLQFDGIVTGFQYSPLAPNTKDDKTSGSRVQLSITVQITYINKYDNNFTFKKKDFTQKKDVEAGLELAEEANMVDVIIQKLIQDIYNASIANW